MSEQAERKHMRYPYTFSAKIAQFPYKFYWHNFWLPRFYAASLVVCFPFFYYIHKKANSPENKALWKEKRRLERQYHYKKLF